jgi:hypothetical protein
MFNEIKRRWYKRIVFLCGNDFERDAALHLIDVHDAKIEREGGLMYKLVMRSVNPFYAAFAQNKYVVRCKDLEEGIDMINEFNDLVGGFVAFNPAVREMV